MTRRGLAHRRALLRLIFLLALFTVSGYAMPPALSARQITERVAQHERQQTSRLAGYRSLRHYSIEYHGFGRQLRATMDAEMRYDAIAGKSFRIVSQSGSGALCNRVLKRALESEVAASKDRAATALTSANYHFRVAGADTVNGRDAYMLDVDPLTPNKFLYRGRIWVDASEFAVLKMEVEPGKNPSFWISHTAIHHINAKAGDFWLPKRNQSTSKVRIGGTATLTIDYGTYQTLQRSAGQIIPSLNGRTAQRRN